jgi:hypothetical protein
MTILRNSLSRVLCKATIFQLVFIAQRHTSRKCLDNKTMHFGHNYFAATNQSIKEYQNSPYNILQGRPIIRLLGGLYPYHLANQTEGNKLKEKI